MTAQRLRVGKIPYANLFPIFYTLETAFDCSSYEFIEGVPSQLNRMLREGAVDISPSSSIEYLRNPSLYRIVEGHSISSRGPVGSIFLFAKRPLHELGGAAVAVTSQSETSIVLLRIILEKFYGVRSSLFVTDRPEEADADAYLLIGDEALRQHAEKKDSGQVHIYDLGEVWHRRTGLPFVFALWIMRPAVGERAQVLAAFLRDLDAAKRRALRTLAAIARHAPMRAFMSEAEILDYWSKLDYELTPEHKEGLALFGRYVEELA